MEIQKNTVFDKDWLKPKEALQVRNFKNTPQQLW